MRICWPKVLRPYQTDGRDVDQEFRASAKHGWHRPNPTFVNDSNGSRPMQSRVAWQCGGPGVENEAIALTGCTTDVDGIKGQSRIFHDDVGWWWQITTASRYAYWFIKDVDGIENDQDFNTTIPVDGLRATAVVELRPRCPTGPTRRASPGARGTPGRPPTGGISNTKPLVINDDGFHGFNSSGTDVGETHNSI